MSDEIKIISRDEIEELEGRDVSLKSDKAVMLKIYKLLKSDISTIKGFVIFISLISIASLIMLIILIQKVNEYGC